MAIAIAIAIAVAAAVADISGVKWLSIVAIAIAAVCYVWMWCADVAACNHRKISWLTSNLKLQCVISMASTDGVLEFARVAHTCAALAPSMVVTWKQRGSASATSAVHAFV
jgi:hypothetical protein